MDPLDPIKKATDELADLSRQRTVIDKRTTELQQFLQTYHSLAQPSLLPDDKPSGAEPRSKADRITQAVTEILSDGTSRHTRSLLVDLAKRGIHVGGQNEIVNLSAILSKQKDRFQADRSVGWSLKQKGPEDASTSSRPSLRVTRTRPAA